MARTRCTWCCSTTAAARLTGTKAAQDPAVHPLRRLYEPLPGLHPHRRPRLRHHLPGPIGKIVSPPAGAGKHERSGDGLEPVRCLRRCARCASPSPTCCSACAGRPNTTHSPATNRWRGRGGQEPARDPCHAGLCLRRHPPAPLSRRDRVARRLRGLMPKHLGPWTQCREVGPKPAPRACTPCCARRRRSPEMSSKEAILSRLRGAATPAHAPP